MSSANNGGNFWTGEGATFECFGFSGHKIEVGDGMEYSTSYAKQFSADNFGTEIQGVNNIYADGTLPTQEYYKKGDVVYKKINEKHMQHWGLANIWAQEKALMYIYLKAHLLQKNNCI